MVDGENVAIRVAMEGLTATKSTIEKATAVYARLGVDGVFGRSDIAAITNNSVASAGKLINKRKDAGLMKAVGGHGKGKYGFIQK